MTENERLISLSQRLMFTDELGLGAGGNREPFGASLTTLRAAITFSSEKTAKGRRNCAESSLAADGAASVDHVHSGHGRPTFQWYRGPRRLPSARHERLRRQASPSNLGTLNPNAVSFNSTQISQPFTVTNTSVPAGAASAVLQVTATMPGSSAQGSLTIYQVLRLVSVAFNPNPVSEDGGGMMKEGLTALPLLLTRASSRPFAAAEHSSRPATADRRIRPAFPSLPRAREPASTVPSPCK